MILLQVIAIGLALEGIPPTNPPTMHTFQFHTKAECASYRQQLKSGFDKTHVNYILSECQEPTTQEQRDNKIEKVLEKLRQHDDPPIMINPGWIEVPK
jgi:hypothetical protein